MVLALAACGGDDSGDSSPTTETPATTADTAPPSTSMTLPADVCQQRDDAGLPQSPHCP